ncbi:hypothetical protein [Paenibacillus sp. FSL L8-0708]|uniref:hypothetical protein n=1 Tax=Paenibacillus sp. FSL L8-0708 TaxID=2975311 RepID=UPI0030F6340C
MWITMQFMLIVFWIIAAFLFYQYKGWKIGSPLDPITGLYLIIRFALIFGLLSSILLGFIYLAFTMSKAEFIPIFTLMVVPVVLVIGFFAKYYFTTSVSNKRDSDLINKTNECREWVQKFPFINNEMIEIKIYISNGKATGRLIVHDVSKSQREEINKNKQGLPDDIHLVVIAADKADYINDPNDKPFH